MREAATYHAFKHSPCFVQWRGFSYFQISTVFSRIYYLLFSWMRKLFCVRGSCSVSHLWTVDCYDCWLFFLQSLPMFCSRTKNQLACDHGVLTLTQLAFQAFLALNAPSKPDPIHGSCPAMWAAASATKSFIGVSFEQSNWRRTRSIVHSFPTANLMHTTLLGGHSAFTVSGAPFQSYPLLVFLFLW